MIENEPEAHPLDKTLTGCPSRAVRAFTTYRDNV